MPEEVGSDGTVAGSCGADSSCASVTVTNTPVPSGPCAVDTVEYPLGKTFSQVRAISLSPVSATAAGQYYDAPQAMTVSGFDVYAWSSGQPFVAVTCQLYLAGPDSLPIGAPLASTAAVIDSSFGNGSLQNLRRVISFTTPVTVNAPYVCVISNTTTDTLSLLCNDFAGTPADGAGEDIGLVQFGTTWLHGSDVTLGPGITFDADWFIHPHVTTDLNANFTPSTTCLTAPNTLVTFTNTSSPVLQNRMYNRAVFLNLNRFSYTWNFGDGSPEVNAVDTTHQYATTGPFTVTLTDTLFGWTGICTADTSITLNPGATAAYSVTTSALTANFTDQSSGTGITSYLWDFGDGNLSSLQNPSHTYASNGNYNVCLTVTSACGSDSTCSTVMVSFNCPPPTAAFSSTSSGLTASFTDQSSSSNTISGYFWDFGDGNLSTLQNPNHTYAAGGSYLVCLTVTDSCGSDSSCATVVINPTSCPTPIAAFNAAANNLTVGFTDQSVTANTISSYLWNFGDGGLSTLANPSHTYTLAGNYTVCLTVADSCGTDSSCATVTVTNPPCPDPVAAFNATTSGLTATFADQSTSGNTILSYLWDFGDGNLSTLQNPSNAYATPGNYAVCLTVTDSCGTDSTCSTVAVDTMVAVGVGLDYVIDVYPKPTRDLLNIRMSLPNSMDVSIRLYNSIGQLIETRSLESVSKRELQLDLSTYAEGAYLIEFVLGDKREIQRFQVIR